MQASPGHSRFWAGFVQKFPASPKSKVSGGGKGEVKPPKCPTRHPGLADHPQIKVSVLICS